jgi:hypothetical protein
VRSGWLTEPTKVRCHSRRTPEPAPVCLERSDLGVDRIFGVNTARVGGEHVRVGLGAPLRPVGVSAGYGDSGLLRVLGGQEEKRTLRDNGKRLRVGFLNGCGYLCRARLIINDQRNQFVTVNTALCVLEGQPRLEASGRR